MRCRIWLVISVALMVILTGGIASAQKGKKQSSAPKGKAGEPVSSTQAKLVITEQERVLAKNYFANPNAGLPPGLARREQLPPGLEKQLRERGTLPPGLQQKLIPLPVELERQMHPLPDGYKRFVVGANIIVMNEKTSLVCDVMINLW